MQAPATHSIAPSVNCHRKEKLGGESQSKKAALQTVTQDFKKTDCCSGCKPRKPYLLGAEAATSEADNNGLDNGAREEVGKAMQRGGGGETQTLIDSGEW